MPTSEKTDLKSSSSSTTSGEEKGRINEVERAEAGDETARAQLYNPEMDVSGVDEKKLMRKLDLWLVPWLSFLYLLSFLDRTSIGNAKVCPAKLWPLSIAHTPFVAVWSRNKLGHQRHAIQYCTDDFLLFVCHLRGQYAIATLLNVRSERESIQVPSNVFLKRLRPSIWLSLLMLMWGVVMVRIEFSSHYQNILTVIQTVQGLVHNYGGLLGKLNASRY